MVQQRVRAALRGSGFSPFTSVEIQNVKIEEIEIGQRHRKDIGDIAKLAESIDEHGLLEPIGVTPDKKLIFGERRIRAFQFLKLDAIPARIIDVAEIVDAEYAENELRKQYTPSELVSIVESIRHATQVRTASANWQSLTTPEAVEMLGLSERTFYRSKSVVDKGCPELIQAMDSGVLSISAAATLAEATHDEQKMMINYGCDEGRLTAHALKKKLKQTRQINERKATDAHELVAPQVSNTGDTSNIQPKVGDIKLVDVAIGPSFAEFCRTTIASLGRFNVANIGDLNEAIRLQFELEKTLLEFEMKNILEPLVARKLPRQIFNSSSK